MAQVAVEFDPFAAEYRADRASAHRRLREGCPVHYHAGRDFYTVARLADITRILLDPATFSSFGVGGPDRGPAPFPPALLTADPPDHTWHRRLVQDAFSPTAV